MKNNFLKYIWCLLFHKKYLTGWKVNDIPTISCSRCEADYTEEGFLEV